MSEISSSPLASTPTLFRQEESRWLENLIKFTSAAFILILCAYYFAPKVARIQTTFYLTLLPATLLLLCWRRDFRFLRSWQFASFLLPPLLLAVSSLWANSEVADVHRKPEYYLKLVVYMAVFYSGLYFVLERRGIGILETWLRWLIPVGLISACASLVNYWLDGSFANLPRIGGISLEGDIDKTAILYGFHALFCCYGLTLPSRRWRCISWSALLVSCAYIVLSQTKVPIAMAGTAILLAAWISDSRVLKGILLLGALAIAPLGYLALFGELPLLQRSNSYSIRFELWGKAFEQFMQSPLIGNGLSYKLYLELHRTLPHPHNYLLDIARYSGLLGVLAFLWQLCAAGLTVLNGYRKIDWLQGTYILWFSFGVLAMLAHAQQPLTKPDYMWFFYWIPLAVLLVHSQLRQK